MPNQYTNKDKVETTIDEEKDEQITTVKHGLIPNKIPSEEEHKAKIQEKNTAAQESTGGGGKKHTIIPLSKTRENYDKLKIPVPYNMADDKRETFERRTKGEWTRKVTSITYYRDLEEQEFLDWNEERTGKTDMKRTITEPISHVGIHDVPIPQQRVEYDAENEENRLVTEQTPAEVNKEYHVKFTKAALKELLDDCNPRTCEFIISQEGQRAYNVSKKELEKYAGDFDTLYNLKADPASTSANKKE